MEIMNLSFEEPLTIELRGQRLSVTVFKSLEEGVYQVGIEAPKSISVNREEVQLAKKSSSEKTIS